MNIIICRHVKILVANGNTESHTEWDKREHTAVSCQSTINNQQRVGTLIRTMQQNQQTHEKISRMINSQIFFITS